MEEYTKINSVYKRTQKGQMLFGEYATDDIAYLADLPWLWTEKVDGTNVRVNIEAPSARVRYGGRTDNSDMPTFLYDRLRDIFERDSMDDLLIDVLSQGTGELPEFVTFYGEGYGAKIQKGGGNYRADGCDFVLFDIKVGDWWLRRAAVEEIADKLALRVVPIVGEWDIPEAVARTRDGEYESAWAGVKPEGIVGRPLVDLFNRKGERILTKIKHKDFKYAAASPSHTSATSRGDAE